MSIRNNYNSYMRPDSQYASQYYMQPFQVNGRVPLTSRTNVVSSQQKLSDFKAKGKLSRSPVIVTNSYMMMNSKTSAQTAQHKQNSHHYNHTRTQVVEIPTVNNIALQAQDMRPLRSKYMTNPIKPESTKSLKNPIINAPKKKAPETYYKLSVPLLNIEQDTPGSNTQRLAAIIRQKRAVYHKIQPIKLGCKDEYSVTSLEQLAGVLERYQFEKPRTKRRSLASSNYTSTLRDRVEHLIVQENANDSIELSFDGKAINKSDFLRMMDSFSLALDDEKNDNEQYVFQTGNILPRDITSGVY
ncbi:HDL450Cp [Eremothecium sinecaudum]|uniref:HDL450Cp n=1 Tax=Eremothecium sinecaudum TaxID=45286 RepID=A0A0X8HRT6_9SACH|nr:HDL450Cp [Eremothecium sinecaudum]AMD20294.1 HDL450Cp [Eremothecium sinecaudum]